MTPEARNRNLSLFSTGSTTFVAPGNKSDDDSNDSAHPSTSHTSSRSRASRSRNGGENMSLSRRNNAAAEEAEVDCILVCTDRAARGVDFEAAPVDHVVLFDFPKDPAEYVRRVGRVARAGRSGISTVLAFGWQLPIARSVMDKAGTLDSATMMTRAANQDDDDDDDDDNKEFRGGARGRRQKKNFGDKNALIKGNIEDGRLWGE
jgi:Helicase conserved C-terminal domain